jgi:hypothetical protein
MIGASSLRSTAPARGDTQAPGSGSGGIAGGSRDGGPGGGAVSPLAGARRSRGGGSCGVLNGFQLSCADANGGAQHTIAPSKAATTPTFEQALRFKAR